VKGIKPVILAVAAAVILKFFVFDFIIAQGHSMESSIYDGTVLVINRLRYGIRMPSQKYLIRWALPKEGEVVIFYTPIGDLAVKRVTSVSNCAVEGYKFYAEGDNSISSYDSRAYGSVHIDSIIGKVLGY